MPKLNARPATLLDGKALATTIEASLRTRIEQHLTRGRERPPHLVAILIGNNDASQRYVQHKEKACQRVGIRSTVRRLAVEVSLDTLLSEIHKLNKDENVDGILIQLPLPPHIPVQTIFESVSPDKDVDGFHPVNMGRLMQKHPRFRSCTPYGIMQLIATTGVPLKGLQATVVGVSNIVGRPMLMELLMAGCTVTACHTATRDLEHQVRQADILVIAIGKPRKIPGDWVKPGAIVIDVGINRLLELADTPAHATLVGDLDTSQTPTKAGWITPVPGGVGPMTITALLQNTLFAYEMNRSELE